MNSREAVLDILLKTLEEGRQSHVIISQTLSLLSDAGKQERSFIKRLAQGTIERRITLDHVIDTVSSVKVKKQKPVIRNILRLSVYQILYMDSIPDSAACNEAVKLAGKRGFKGLAGFINGVLRNICRRHDEFLHFDKLSLQYSFPEWIIDMWEKAYGRERTEGMLKYFLCENSTSVRVRTGRISADELAERLKAQGITAEQTGDLKEVLHLSGYDSLESIPEFSEGLFTVQDESSAHVAASAGLKCKDRVLDLCAAPGGKSMHAADILEVLGGGSVVSCDLTRVKTDMIRDNIRRCRYDNIEVLENDALIYREDFCEAFDVVLADLPCSGLGIIGKKPDIKYNASKEKLKELSELQRNILVNAVKYVKPGGTLCYSTCTVNRGENEDNAEFIEQKLGLKKLSEKQFIPGEEGTDGFYIAVFRRQ